MYVVICSDSSSIDMTNFRPFKMQDNVFGPFSEKYDAEEWVDDNCGKKYWIIVRLNDKTIK